MVPLAMPVGATVTANVGVATTVGVVARADVAVDEASGVPVPVGVPDALGLAVAVADDDGVEVADALADTPAVGVAELVAVATRVGVAVGAAWPAAAGGGSNPHSRPATSRPGTTIRLINGRMRVSIVKWISDNSLGLYLPNPIPTQ